MTMSAFSPAVAGRGPAPPVRAADRRGASPWPRRLRQWHLYAGVLFAPAILFLAFTGAFQVFSLHKPDRTTGYEPPAWAVTLAGVHKRQTLAPKADDDPAPAARKRGRVRSPGKAAPPMRVGTLALKIFELGAACSLVLSTLSGLYLALRTARRPRLLLALLAAGTFAPLAALLL
jgi:hypothetical protein